MRIATTDTKATREARRCERTRSAWLLEPRTARSEQSRSSRGCSPRRAPWRCAEATGRPEPSYSVGRYYDPTTGQFLTVDPLVDLTGQPYAYTGDDPVNEIDSIGASGQMPSAYTQPCKPSPVSCKGGAPDLAGVLQFVHDHPTVGLALGTVSTVAAFAALSVTSPVVAATLVFVSAVAGGIAIYGDISECVHNLGLNAQCVAAGLGTVGLGLGLGGLGEGSAAELSQGAILRGIAGVLAADFAGLFDAIHDLTVSGPHPLMTLKPQSANANWYLQNCTSIRSWRDS